MRQKQMDRKNAIHFNGRKITSKYDNGLNNRLSISDLQ